MSISGVPDTIQINMKILVLNYEYPPLGGGASPISKELSEFYIKLGNKVDVITMSYGNLPKFETIKNVNIFRVPSFRSKKEICYPWEQLSYVLSAILFLSSKLRTEKYDVIHCHFIIPTGIVALWAHYFCKIPYLITAHGSDVPGFNTDRFKLLHKFTKPLLQQILKHSKYIVSPSKYLASLISTNISDEFEKKLVHIPNGMDDLKFSPKKKKSYIFSSGRLLPRKGFQYLIKAVRDVNLGYEVHIAGDGPYREQLEALAKNSKTKIIFHGWLDNQGSEYKKLLEEASIYCLLSERENASIALLEAMSAGCCIISFKNSGTTEVLLENLHTSLAHSSIPNIDEIRKTIIEVIQNNADSEIGRKYYTHFKNNFTLNKIGKKYLDLLGE